VTASSSFADAAKIDQLKGIVGNSVTAKKLSNREVSRDAPHSYVADMPENGTGCEKDILAIKGKSVAESENPDFALEASAELGFQPGLAQHGNDLGRRQIF
jgi:hypothetical protein